MKHNFQKKLFGQIKKSFFFTVRLLIILFSCTHCEKQTSFELSQRKIRDDLIKRLSDANIQIIINYGNEYTKERNVNLSFIPSEDADEMFISFESDCSTGEWEPLKTNKRMDLRDINNESFVYVKYRFRGEEETVCVGDSIIHDNLPPTVSFNNPPTSWIAEKNINIEIQATDSGSGIELIQCDRQGSGQFESCSQNIVYNSLVENQNHLLVVKAQDKAGNVSEPKQINWRSDQSSPSLTLSLGPAALTADTNPHFSFLAIDTGSGVSHLECRLDNAAQFSRCQSSQFSLSNLSEGAHRIEVKAVDNVGRFSDPLVHSWTQATTTPTIHFTAKPDKVTRSQTANFSFAGINAQQGIVSYKCQLDNGTSETCTSPKTLPGLSNGKHIFSVIGMDALGRPSSPIDYRWVVDRTKPTLTLVNKPGKKTRFQEARFVLQASDSDSGIKEIHCKVDNENYQVCPGFFEKNNLSEGTHRFLAKSIDRAGNESTELSYEWLIDRTKPIVKISSGPKKSTNQIDASFVFTSQDSGGSGIENTECQLNGGSFETCESPKLYPELADGDHIFSVRARDEAGNVSEVKIYNWSIDTTQPIITFSIRPEANVYIGDTAQIQFSISNSQGTHLDEVQCSFNGTDYPCSENTLISLPATETRNNTFKVTAFNNLGNQNSETLTWQTKIESVSKQITKSSKAPIDILFVVDSSATMNKERKKLAEKFHGFINMISDLDWQIAVTTTDVTNRNDRSQGRLTNFYNHDNAVPMDISISGETSTLTRTTGNFMNEGVEVGDDIKLFGYTDRDNNARLTVTSVTALTITFTAHHGMSDENGSGDTGYKNHKTTQILKSNMMNNDITQTLFENHIQTLSNGSYSEQGIAAAYQAVGRYEQNESPHSNFFRDDAQLAFVVISDEDENSNGQNIRHTPQEFVEYISNSFTNKIFAWHSIVRTGRPRKTKYERLSELTNGITADIYSPDYTSHLTNIGESVKNLQKQVALGCTPVDDNLDGNIEMEVKFKASGESSFQIYSGTYTIHPEQQRLVFDQPLELGDYQFNFKCAKE